MIYETETYVMPGKLGNRYWACQIRPQFNNLDFTHPNKKFYLRVFYWTDKSKKRSSRNLLGHETIDLIITKMGQVLAKKKKAGYKLEL